MPKQWTWAPAKPKAVPPGVRDELNAKAQELIETQLKPSFIQPPPKSPKWNYIVAIFTKWRGVQLYFMARYACPGSNTNSPFFEEGFVRLEYRSNGNFNLAYKRHTSQWLELHSDVSMEEAIRIVHEEPHFHP